MRQGSGAGGQGGTGKRLLLALCLNLPLCPSAALPLFAQCPDGSPPPCRAARAAVTPNSVAVLYFDNLSRDSADTYLADGLTEQVIQRLGQVGRVTVKSKYAVRRYRGTDVDPTVVGRALLVSYIGGGSVRRSGNRLRVNVELTRAATGDRVWGESYDRADADVLAIEEEIAGAVATAIAGQLLPGERARVGARVTSNPAAYHHFIRGNHLVARRTPETVRRGIAEYEAALRADPGLSDAGAALAYGYGVYASWEWPWPGLSRDSVLARGRHAADAALRSDSTNPLARLGACLHELNTGRDVGRLLTCQRRILATERGSRSADVLSFMSWALMNAGQNDAATDYFQRTLAVDPGRVITLEVWGRMETRARRFAEARRLLDSAIAVDPEFQPAYHGRARLRLLDGDIEGALADVQTATRLTPGVPITVGVWAVARSDTARAEAMLRDIMANADPGYAHTTLYGGGYAAALEALGRRDEAIGLLQGIPRDYALYAELQNPEFDPLRSDPRFQRIFEQSRPAVFAPGWVVPR